MKSSFRACFPFFIPHGPSIIYSAMAFRSSFRTDLPFFIPHWPSILHSTLAFHSSFRTGIPFFIPHWASILHSALAFHSMHHMITSYNKFHRYASLSGLHNTSTIGLPFSHFAAITHLVPSSSALSPPSFFLLFILFTFPTYAVILYSEFKPFSSKLLPFFSYSFQYNKILSGLNCLGFYISNFFTSINFLLSLKLITSGNGRLVEKSGDSEFVLKHFQVCGEPRSSTF